MSETNDKKPLVTVALFAYNSEELVGDAVESLLAQTYSPLEIILSDDCSTDGTFEVMRRLAEEKLQKITITKARKAAKTIKKQ